MCGRVLDATTGRRAAGDELDVRIYDERAWLASPTNAAELGRASVDPCGGYIATELPLPPSGTAVVVVGGASDRFVPTWERQVAHGGLRVIDRVLPLVRRRDALAWRYDLLDRGARLVIFESRMAPGEATVGAPVEGIVVSGSAFYFADTSPLARTAIDPLRTATGANGSVLLVGGSDDVHAAGTAGDCMWPATRAVSVPGTIGVTETLAVCD